MAATVVSVVIFLCGVLVGRGVRSQLGVADATRGRAPVAETTPHAAGAPAPAPPPAGSDPHGGGAAARRRRPQLLQSPREAEAAGGAVEAGAEAIGAGRAPPRRAAARGDADAAAPTAPPRSRAAPSAPAPAPAVACAAGAGRPGIRGADRRAERAQRSGRDRQAPQLERLRGLRAHAGQRDAVGVPRARRQVHDAPRSRDDRREAAKRRAVQALGHALIACPPLTNPSGRFRSRSASPRRCCASAASRAGASDRC